MNFQQKKSSTDDDEDENIPRGLKRTTRLFFNLPN